MLRGFICSVQSCSLALPFSKINEVCFWGLKRPDREAVPSIIFGNMVIQRNNLTSFNYIKDHQQMSLFVIFLYCMSQPYVFRASISPSSGVSLAVVTCCHLVHAVLCVCPRASGSFDVVTPDDGLIEARNM